MSAKNNGAAKEEEGSDVMCCAFCGIGEVDDIKLKICTACKLVRYCSVKCQKKHRLQHKNACKKRAAEIRDELLFKQPESSYYGDCPICLLPLSIDPRKSTLMDCCSKLICNGCDYANDLRMIEQSLEITCPFCRHSFGTDEEADINIMKRAEVNDPVAIYQMGLTRHAEGDYDGALEYWTKAAELGNIKSHYQLSHVYGKGEGVEKDKKKGLYHLEQAAIGGDPDARYDLGCVEEENGRNDRAIKHLIIAANLGHVDSLDALKGGFKSGLVTKEDYAMALRGHQAAVDATKSPQRDDAEAALQALQNLDSSAFSA